MITAASAFHLVLHLLTTQELDHCAAATGSVGGIRIHLLLYLYQASHVAPLARVRSAYPDWDLATEALAGLDHARVGLAVMNGAARIKEYPDRCAVLLRVCCTQLIYALRTRLCV